MGMTLNSKMQDRVSVGDYEETPEGYLVFRDVQISRTGIQVYKGYELGLEPDDYRYMDDIAVYRPDEEVFSTDSMASLTNKPVTDEHPWDMLDSSNIQDHQRGHTGSNAKKSGKHVVLDTVTITDASLVNKFKMGTKKEVSAGYSVDWKEESGTVPDTGESYDLVQTNIRGNHLAVVARGRCGSSCALSDSEAKKLKTNTKGSDMETVTMIIDGVPHEVTAQGKAIIDKLTDDNTIVAGKYEKLKKESLDAETKIKAEYDVKLADKDKEIAELSKNQMTPQAVDAAMKSRQHVADTAKEIMPEDYTVDGKGCDVIKKDVVANQLGDEAIEGKDEVYIEAAFDMIQKALKDSKNSDSSDNFLTRSLDNNHDSTVEDSREKYITDLKGRHKLKKDK